MTDIETNIGLPNEHDKKIFYDEYERIALNELNKEIKYIKNTLEQFESDRLNFRIDAEISTPSIYKYDNNDFFKIIITINYDKTSALINILEYILTLELYAINRYKLGKSYGIKEVSHETNEEIYTIIINSRYRFYLITTSKYLHNKKLKLINKLDDQYSNGQQG